MHARARQVIAVIAITGAAFAAGCSSGGGGDKAGDKKSETTTTEAGGDVSVEAGQKVFAATCAACHGPDAKGLPDLGKDLTTSTFAKGLSDDELVTFIEKGRDTTDPANTTGVAMPPKGGNPALTDDDIKSVVEYVRTLEG
jgi:disulfide bond formation protein DsbB